MIINEDDYLAHYGTPRHSGRYPWGSGGNDEQLPRNMSFDQHVLNLKKQGLSEVEIARGMNISTTQLRARASISKNQQRMADITQAEKLRAKGMSNVEIGKTMGGRNESWVRSLLAPGAKEKSDVLTATSEMLRDQVAQKTYVDVGSGVENQLGLTNTKLNTAVSVLKEQGYEVHSVPIPQLGTGLNTKTKVLCPPGTTWGEVMKNRNQIQQIKGHTDDGGLTYDLGIHPPIQIHPNRVGVVYGSEGGSKADGVIFVRPGVHDVSLGGNNYAQVRIQVGPDHYLKGMAMYKDDLPKGVDLMFNTNKEHTGNKLDAFKKINKDDPDNPFGAVVKQNFKKDDQGVFIRDAKGNKVLDNAMNMVNEEGAWKDWSKTVSTQMLSKQSPALAKSQLDMTFERRTKEFNDLNKLTNPTVRKTLLEKFGDETDAAAVHLDAAGINSRQGWHAILPVSSIPPGQVYAPKFRNGEQVVLIRFPHAGRFEIPELTVNNNHPESKKLLGNARDAVGIHHSVAERLSGADFDGDTVLVIPNGNRKVKTAPALEGLKNFEPKKTYAPYDGMKTIDGGHYREATKDVDYGGKSPSPKGKGLEMGKISNLITDMSLRNASSEEVARAVRHSMVVIDAEKHHLDYKRSYTENNIGALKEKYQGGANKGAATLISRATAEKRVEARKPRLAKDGGPIDKVTGKRVFIPTNEVDFRTGKPRTIKSTRLAETEDARTLLSNDGIGTPMERLYADHSNKLKALANEARRVSVNTPPLKYSPSAKKVYADEATRLNSALQIAKQNRPRERQAQILANTLLKARTDANPNMDEATKKKLKGQILTEARRRTGADKDRILISDREWEAIQAGAISDSRLREILSNADVDRVRELATPRQPRLMTSSKINRAQSMLASGYSRSQIADALGVSLSTLDEATVQHGMSRER